MKKTYTFSQVLSFDLTEEQNKKFAEEFERAYKLFNLSLSLMSKRVVCEKTSLVLNAVDPITIDPIMYFMSTSKEAAARHYQEYSYPDLVIQFLFVTTTDDLVHDALVYVFDTQAQTHSAWVRTKGTDNWKSTPKGSSPTTSTVLHEMKQEVESNRFIRLSYDPRHVHKTQ